MDWQVAFNIAFAALGTLGGWVLKVLHESLRDLQMADDKLATKVQAIEVLVAGQYVPRPELEVKFDSLFKKLDRIENLVIRTYNADGK